MIYKPLAETVRDTLAWESTRPADEERQAGLAAADEIRLLSRWKEKHRDSQVREK